MNRRLFQFAILLLWLALPITALQYQRAWDRLPVHVATHFNAQNQANGWMSREESLHFSLWMIAIALIVATVLLAAVAWHKVEAFSWALFGFFGLLIGFLIAVDQAILDFNLYGTTTHPERLMWVPAVAVIALIVTYLTAHRQTPLPSGETIAVETHAGRIWSAVILLALLGPALAISLAPGGVLWPLIPLGVIGAGALAMAWSGFRYRFLQHGVEVSMLGLRLRSIPRSAILSYSIEPWAFIRGYGIRGIGSTRAYVWCNKVVHIRTSNGDIFLGHNEPGKILHDLDRVMGVVTRG